MRIVPVLDLKDGVVVHGVGGRRAEYRPIVSQLTPSCFPVSVADAFREHFGLSELYLADLDAIAGKPPALELFRELRRRGFTLWVDSGLHFTSEAIPLSESGVERVVAGLETLADPGELNDQFVFSLDLKAGQPLGRWGRDAWEIANLVIERGVRRLLILDLARVGEGQGTGTEELCARLVKAFPDVEVSAGGGVRGVADLQRLQQCGVSAALVASALHDGRLTQADLAVISDSASPRSA